MANQLVLALSVFAAAVSPLAAADLATGLEAISKDRAEKYLSGGTEASTPAAMYIWSDKYVYQPGESLTLRWTVKSNADYYPYTIFAYRVNNQTGAKSFFPGGGSAPVDIYGNTREQGYRIVRLPDATKQVLLGASGLIGSAATIPSDLGMHTMVIELRDYMGGRVIRAAYQKIGVVDGEVSVSGDITANQTWVNTKVYRIVGLTTVKNNAVLTINPGTFVIGNPGTTPPTALLVSRTGRLVAEGTRTSPIIMTSSRPFGQRAPQDWGGLIMLGRGRINVPGGEEGVEGLPKTDDTTYGGDDDNFNCGSLRYVRVEFAGSPFQPNQEVNSFTWAGCGKQTKLEYLQAHYGFDDAFEWFGGTADAKYLVATYGRDDAFDWQTGWRGRLQFGLAYANDDLTNMGIEADNYDRDNAATPISFGQMYNLTFIGAGTRGADETNTAAVFLRRGTKADLNNIVAMNWANWGLRVIDPLTLTYLGNGEIKMNGVLLWNNGSLLTPPRANTVEGQVEPDAVPFANGTSGQGRQFVVADAKLARPFERSSPDFRGMFDSPIFGVNWVLPPADGFFDQAAGYLGAFGEIDWTEEWVTFLQEQDIQP